ncbi:MAG: glutamine amidotransferase [Nocardioides sp.]|nr:glutamine amidotransferase [Nocardioides sp.]
MRPFLFLGIRAEDDAADDEHEAFCRYAGLAASDVRRVRLERDELGPVDLEELSGIVLGGGPFNVSDAPETKSGAQVRTEARLRDLTAQVVAADFPFLGACYGIGTLGTRAGGVVDRQHAEPIGAVTITLTAGGLADPLFGDLPPTFDAFLGHQEAVSRLPAGAVLLASSATCPVQAFRLGTRVYATQFHPELDADGICKRIEIYRDHGYYAPHEGAELLRRARAAVVTEPTRLLRRFVELFAR